MTRIQQATPAVGLRKVEDQDLAVFFAHQSDPRSAAMAAFPPRDEARFAEHWSRIRADRTVVTRTILVEGSVAGHIGCWQQDGQHLLGYWVGRAWWGRGVASRALALFLDEVSVRPLRAHAAVHNLGSVRVLEKCGFRRDHAQEAEAPPPEDGVEEVVLVLET
jgi:RimJ/RimL family protein N-acetyltransferase